MSKFWRFLMSLVTLAAAVGQGDSCDAQIIFNGIDPGNIPTYSDDPKALRRDPIAKENKPSKPYAPMPHFSNRNILADRIQMGTISKDDLRPDHIIPDKMHFNVITQEYIAPQPLSRKPVLPAMSPGERITAPPTLAQPIWSFDQTLRGESKPTERIGSSIYQRVPNYDMHQSSPLPTEWRQQEAAFRPTHPTHPMSW